MSHAPVTPAPFSTLNFVFEEQTTSTPTVGPGPSQRVNSFFRQSQTEQPIRDTVEGDLDVVGALCEQGDNWIENVLALGASAPVNSTPFGHTQSTRGTQSPSRVRSSQVPAPATPYSNPGTPVAALQPSPAALGGPLRVQALTTAIPSSGATLEFRVSQDPYGPSNAVTAPGARSVDDASIHAPSPPPSGSAVPADSQGNGQADTENATNSQDGQPVIIKGKCGYHEMYLPDSNTTLITPGGARCRLAEWAYNNVERLEKFTALSCLHRRKRARMMLAGLAFSKLNKLLQQVTHSSCRWKTVAKLPKLDQPIDPSEKSGARGLGFYL